MGADEEKIKRILDTLYRTISIGWRSFRIAKYIQDANNKGKVKSAFGFFQGAYEACLDIACLNIAKVLIKDASNPANIWYLLNCIQSSPDPFRGVSKQDIISFVNDHTRRLEDFQETISKIEKQRHNLVHIDKRLVNNPRELYTDLGVLEEDELDKSYALAFNIIDTYYGCLMPSQDVSNLLDYWNSMIKEDVEFIVGQTAKDDE